MKQNITVLEDTNAGHRVIYIRISQPASEMTALLYSRDYLHLRNYTRTHKAWQKGLKRHRGACDICTVHANNS